MLALLTAIASILTVPVCSLIGFDCGGQHLNITTISLLGAGDCNLQPKITNQSEVYIQLLQLTKYNYAEVMQCKVEIQRTVYHCGMHSHVSIVRNGEAGYLEETNYERCKRMHQDGIINMGFGPDSLIKGLKVNRTGTYGVTFAGTVKENGECKGVTSYTDPYGTWYDVVVQGTAKVTLRTSYVPVHLESGKIHLKSGTICELKDGYCIDPDHGYTFWKPVPRTTCDFHEYDVLYEGTASKIMDNALETYSPVIYSLVTQDITFALTATLVNKVCGYRLQRTEHPKLFILETSKGNVPKKQEEIPVDHLDIFTYVNSKFVYVEKHIRTQMTSLYHNVMRQRCELEAEVLKNTLSFATLLPDEFAFRLMKQPGYMAVAAGEAIHVVKCIPIDVMARRTNDCYLELPVNVRNSSMFLTPKSRIVTKFGTQRECSHELPTLYQIEDVWVQFLPEPHVYQVPPQLLQPMTKISWKYLTPGPLAESGIYSTKDINKLRDHIMFPAEKPALLNSVARGINGYSMGGNAPPLHQLLDEDALNKLAKTTAAKLWGSFVTFGSATAGVFGIFLIIRLIKIVIDTAIHGYALHTAYGCSVHLLGALWSSLTHLLLHLAHPPTRKKDVSAEDPDVTRQQTPGEPKNPHSNFPSAPSVIRADLRPSTSLAYKDLNERLSLMEERDKTPNNVSEFYSKREGDVTSRSQNL